jgi:hypothetical protein
MTQEPNEDAQFDSGSTDNNTRWSQTGTRDYVHEFSVVHIVANGYQVLFPRR